MPGIYGFSNTNDKNQACAMKSMQQAMYLKPTFHQDNIYRNKSTSASRTHLGNIGMKNSPLTSEKGHSVWIEGEVYNLPEIINQLGWPSKGSIKNEGFAEWMLYAYAHGELDKFLKHIDGYYCASIYDPIKNKILLISDRYGMRMLYWYHRNGIFSWSSEVKGILALPDIDKTIDETSFTCFMDLGYLLGEHTWFENIHLIKPASIIEHDIVSDQTQHHYYWTWDQVKPSTISLDDAIDSLHESFLNAVKRRFNSSEKIGISLSGGLDSRAIFSALNTIAPNYENYAYTFGTPECDDIKIAHQVTMNSAWKHEQFHFSHENWFKPRFEMIWNTDGMLDMKHMHGGEFLPSIAKNIDINLNGYLGDVVAGGSWTGNIPLNSRATIKGLKGFYRNHAKLSMIEDSYFNIEHSEPSLFINRARRFTNMGTVNGLVAIDHRKPFFDNEVLNWALSTPEEYRSKNLIYSIYLKRHHSKLFSTIPWQNTGKITDTLKESSLPTQVLNKIVKTIKHPLGVTSSKDYTHYSQWIREPHVKKYLDNILHSNNSFYNHLANKNWKKHSGIHTTSSRLVDKSDKVLRAATVEIYLRQAHKEHIKPW